MVTTTEGAEISFTDTAEWAALSPIRGQVIEVHMGSTDMNISDVETWAAFIILQVSTKLDGSIVLRVRHLGCEDEKLGKQLDAKFNKKVCSLHLCLSVPCIDVTPDGGVMVDDYLHVTQVRLWTFAGFEAAQTYVAEDRFRTGHGWLAGDGEGMKPPRRRTAAPKVKTSPKEAAKPATKAKRAKPSKGAEGESKITEEDKAALRSKLKDIRQRLQEVEKPTKGKKKAKESEDESDEDEEDVSSGYSADQSDFAPAEAGLTTGTELALPELGTPAPRKKKPKTRSGGHSGRKDQAEGTSASTLSGLSGQLVQRALEVTRQRKRASKKKGKTATKAQKLTTVLTKLLNPDKKEEKKSKDKKKKRRKRLSDGTILSWSGSTDSSTEGGSEEQDSEEDLEAPLRKKSRDRPGSVLSMLVSHVKEQLEQGAVTEMSNDSNQVTSGVKILSYFNLFIKASYPTHLRELRELHHLAACLDLIRAGDIARAADGLSARFIAVHQSMVDGSWNTARHMELYPLEETSAAGAAAILATRKHAKLVAKVQGLPATSWTSSNSKGGKSWKGKGDWGYPESRNDAKGGGKGKGRGKKGKGNWDNRPSRDWGKDKEKTEEKPKN
eukprot:s120_g45.t1